CVRCFLGLNTSTPPAKGCADGSIQQIPLRSEQPTRSRHRLNGAEAIHRIPLSLPGTAMLMPSVQSLGELENPSEFIARHIGVSQADEAHMLSVIGEASRRALIDSIVPRSIARSSGMQLPPVISEAAALAELKTIAGKNQLLKSFIGQGYYGTHTPGVILRNVLENPAWYTAYTPYQAEISQG